MEPVIQFTLSQAWAVVLSICGGIVCIAGAVGVIIKIVKAAKKPNARQNEQINAVEQRVDRMERKMEQFESYFQNDNDRLDLLDKGMRVTQHALIALLSHGIDGNDVESLKKAKHELEEYLITK